MYVCMYACMHVFIFLCMLSMYVHAHIGAQVRGDRATERSLVGNLDMVELGKRFDYDPLLEKSTSRASVLSGKAFGSKTNYNAVLSYGFKVYPNMQY